MSATECIVVTRALSLAAQCIVIGPDCGFVAVFVCYLPVYYHDELEIAWIDPHQTGLQWLKWSCEAGGSSDEARLEQTPYLFHTKL